MIAFALANPPGCYKELNCPQKKKKILLDFINKLHQVTKLLKMSKIYSTVIFRSMLYRGYCNKKNALSRHSFPVSVKKQTTLAQGQAQNCEQRTLLSPVSLEIQAVHHCHKLIIDQSGFCVMFTNQPVHPSVLLCRTVFIKQRKFIKWVTDKCNR